MQRMLFNLVMLFILNHAFFVDPSHAGSIQLPATGQTVTYAIADDGSLKNGVAWQPPRFTDLNDGTVIDNLTGLNWLKNANCFGILMKDWKTAISLANGLVSGACGLTDSSKANDWQLPNVEQLESLVDISQSNSALPLGHPFSNVRPFNYWSSSTDSSDTSYAWYVNMNDNGVNTLRKSNLSNVWPVRSGQFWAQDSLVFSTLPTFGINSIGFSAPSRKLIIHNRGSSDQTVTSMIVSGTNATEFSITTGGSNPCNSVTPTLTAGASCTLMLGFSPRSSGSKSAFLDISVINKTISIPLSGKAITILYGSVTDQATGLPVSGASVTLNTSSTTTTDSSGNYNFTNLPVGNYSICISKSSYQTTSMSGLVVTSTAPVRAETLLPTVGTLNITSSSLPWASPNILYSNRVMVAGGTAHYTFSKPYGNLPTGLSLDTTTGIINGTPTGTGSYIFAVGVTDYVLGYSEKEFTIELLQPLQITTEFIPSGQQGTPYNSSISATGGKPGYTFILYEGALPKGITLSSNGRFSGTPRESGTFNVQVRVTDSTGRIYDNQYSLTLDAAPVLGLNTSVLPAGVKDNFFSTTLSASGGVTPLVFSVLEPLPPGLSLKSSTGTINGTPTSAGFTNLTITVTDNSYPAPKTVTKTLSLRIWPSQPYSLIVTMSGDGSGTVNSNPAGISCASDITSGCDILFLSSASLTLYATPSADSLFENWSGACTNTSGDCSITMNSNKAVTATFIAAPKAMVDGGKSFSTMQAAYDDTATTTDSVIKLLEGSFANTLVAGRGISVKLEGGYNAAYDAFSTETIIQGPMKIKAGTIRMKGVKVK